MKNFLFALRYLRKLRGGTVARVVSLSLGLAVGLLVGHLPAVAFRPLGSRCLLAACRRLGVCRP